MSKKRAAEVEATHNFSKDALSIGGLESLSGYMPGGHTEAVGVECLVPESDRLTESKTLEEI